MGLEFEVIPTTPAGSPLDGPIRASAGWGIPSTLYCAIRICGASGKPFKHARILVEFRGETETTSLIDAGILWIDDMSMERYGRRFAQIVQVVVDDETIQLDENMEVIIPFTIHLPTSGLPPSFENKAASISYHIKCTLSFSEPFHLLRTHRELRTPVIIEMPEPARDRLLKRDSAILYQTVACHDKCTVKVNISLLSMPTGQCVTTIKASLVTTLDYILTKKKGVQHRLPWPVAEETTDLMIVDPVISLASLESPFLSIKTAFKLEIILGGEDFPNTTVEIPVVVVPLMESERKSNLTSQTDGYQFPPSAPTLPQLRTALNRHVSETDLKKSYTNLVDLVRIPDWSPKMNGSLNSVNNSPEMVQESPTLSNQGLTPQLAFSPLDSPPDCDRLVSTTHFEPIFLDGHDNAESILLAAPLQPSTLFIPPPRNVSNQASVSSIFGSISSASESITPTSPHQQAPSRKLSVVVDPQSDFPFKVTRSKSVYLVSRSRRSVNAHAIHHHVPSQKMTLDARPWFLAADYSVGTMLFDESGHLLGGTFDTLVELLTTHERVPDPDFVVAFLHNFHRFSSSSQLVLALMHRIQMAPPTLSAADLKVWIENKKAVVHIRVYAIFKLWLDKFWIAELDNPILSVMKAFLDEMVQQITSETSMEFHFIELSLLNTIAAKISLIEIEGPTAGTYTRPSQPNPRAGLPGPVSVVPKRLALGDVDALEFARQLTLIQNDVFCAIHPTELLAKAWSKRSQGAALNVKRMIQMSNQISNWVMVSVLTLSEPVARAQIIKYFIKVSLYLLSLDNYDGLMAVLMGLLSSSIIRLKITWDLIPEAYLNIFKETKAIFDPARNYLSYRAQLKSINPPCVPFLGTFLTDLTFTEDGNPDRFNGGLINFEKHAKITATVLELERFKMDYVLAPLSDVQEWILGAICGADKDANTLYRLSLRVEPKPGHSELEVDRGEVDKESPYLYPLETSTFKQSDGFEDSPPRLSRRSMSLGASNEKNAKEGLLSSGNGRQSLEEKVHLARSLIETLD
ncbi:ras guanine nucleotide exchange factor domain-containing protein [Chytriomyces sp. MP71]|nr:ras guanine nucleotide exchange factor domain-containing protein [Chytriomyces sp. MP71]